MSNNSSRIKQIREAREKKEKFIDKYPHLLNTQYSSRKQYEMHYPAVKYFEKKLQSNPTMPRYNHLMAMLKVSEHDHKAAEGHFVAALHSNPSDIAVRSDYALLLARKGEFEASKEQYRKATIVAPDSIMIRKNLSAVHARQGDLSTALQHATRTLQIAPDDPVAHRNFAKIRDAMGNTEEALQHNLTSLSIEQVNGVKSNPKALRSAAVQIISNGIPPDSDLGGGGVGGDRIKAASRLMDAARAIEGERVSLPTSTRTYEIISNILKRKGNPMDALNKEKEKLL